MDGMIPRDESSESGAAFAASFEANAATLRDTHWIGDDPARLQVYGWASWRPGHAIVSLRNPSDQPQEFALDVERALELPQDAAKDWTATPVYVKGTSLALHAGQGAPVTLQPFEVRVWDLVPDATESGRTSK